MQGVCTNMKRQEIQAIYLELKKNCQNLSLSVVSIAIDDIRTLFHIPSSYKISHISSRILNMLPQNTKIYNGSTNKVEYICFAFDADSYNAILNLTNDITEYYRNYYTLKNANQLNVKIAFSSISLIKGYAYPTIPIIARRVCPHCGNTLILRVVYSEHLNRNIAFVSCGSINSSRYLKFCHYKYQIAGLSSIDGINILQYQHQEPIYSRNEVLTFYQNHLKNQPSIFIFDIKDAFNKDYSVSLPIPFYIKTSTRYLWCEGNSTRNRTHYSNFD